MNDHDKRDLLVNVVLLIVIVMSVGYILNHFGVI